MSSQKKQEEQKQIAEKQKIIEEINKLTNLFASSNKGNENLTPTTTIQNLQTQLYQIQNEQRNQHREIFDYERSSLEAKVKNYDELNNLCQNARQKLEYQMNLKRDARETSGTKDAEQDTGVYTLAEKEKLRKENPNASIREIYEKLRNLQGVKRHAPDKPVQKTTLTPQMTQTKGNGR